MEKERTLILHGGGIGDLLLAGPAIEGLARTASITLAGIPERAALLQMGQLVDSICSLDSFAFSSVFGTPQPRFRQFMQQFQRVVIWMHDPDDQILCACQEAGIGNVDIYPGLPPDTYVGHAAQYYCDCLGLPCPLPWRLPFPPGEACNGQRCLIHPGSGSPQKNWPLSHFQALAQELEQAGKDVEWLWGPAEMEHLPARVTNAPLRSLSELACHIHSAGLYIGNDSGITHLAAVLGIPTVAIFGPSNPARWRPIGPQTAVLKGEAFPAYEAVLRELEAFLQ